MIIHSIETELTYIQYVRDIALGYEVVTYDRESFSMEHECNSKWESADWLYFSILCSATVISWHPIVPAKKKKKTDSFSLATYSPTRNADLSLASTALVYHSNILAKFAITLSKKHSLTCANYQSQFHHPPHTQLTTVLFVVRYFILLLTQRELPTRKHTTIQQSMQIRFQSGLATLGCYCSLSSTDYFSLLMIQYWLHCTHTQCCCALPSIHRLSWGVGEHWGVFLPCSP